MTKTYDGPAPKGDTTDGAKPQEGEKVISLADRRNRLSGENGTTRSGDEPSPDFDDVMRRNEKNRERVATERSSANKSVLRSYRIKQ